LTLKKNAFRIVKCVSTWDVLDSTFKEGSMIILKQEIWYTQAGDSWCKH